MTPDRPLSPRPLSETPSESEPPRPQPVSGKPKAPRPIPQGTPSPKPMAPKPIPQGTPTPKPMAPTPIPKEQAAQPKEPTPTFGGNIPASKAMPRQLGPGARPIPVPKGDKRLLTTKNPEEEENEEPIDEVFKKAPPWLISIIAHVVVLLIGALWWFSTATEKPLVVDANWSEEEGFQLEDDSFEVDTEVPEEMEVLTEMPETSDPFAAAAQLDIPTFDAGQINVSTIDVPGISMQLEGRSPGMKKALLRKYGGSKESEDAVNLALGWLEKQQNKREGSWSLKGPYEDGANRENRMAATAMAMLAFQGAGHTHRDGEYIELMQKGLNFLLAGQDEEGSFYDDEAFHSHRFYTHGQATIVVCELYAMTRDPRLKVPAERAINYIVESQDPDHGGWRYGARKGSDTSVSGWCLMALQSARMGGFQIPPEVFDEAGRYLDSASDQDASLYGYLAPNGPNGTVGVTEVMTAEALLCRQYLGWARKDKRMQRGASWLMQNLPSRQKLNYYYWYYGTQFFHHLEGALWERWNSVTRDLVVSLQETKGKEIGSWGVKRTAWGDDAGRLYTTCFAIFILEVYYRHLPIYTEMAPAESNAPSFDFNDTFSAPTFP
ncbi:Squalene--hopene cyclase [Planctomycetales bacterium 10988]|nr:Squalene--hopene cyclase [Planctomycetales bacterium 10988]